MGCAAIFLVALGCSGPEDADAGTDGGDVDCPSADDGTSCGEGSICVGGACVTRRCGDMFVDVGEQCDDGNEVAFDGCEPTSCSFTCESNADCEDPEPCNGDEICGEASHVCEAGTRLEERAACTNASVTDGVCRTMMGAPRCVPAGCGNGVLESPDEICDDGNEDPDDGCEPDCTYSCVDDSTCPDGDACNGEETCDLSTHACVAGTEPDCDDESDCTADSCDMVLGCINDLIDADGDGYASETIGACGTDCDDDERQVNPGRTELCGNATDDDCNPATSDAVNTVYYHDCDGDGYAATGAGNLASCAAPSTEPCGPGSGWTALPPTASRIDCDDDDPARSPGEPDLCDGLENDCDTAVDEDVSPETCNGIDDNCNSLIDEALTRNCYADGDGDGAGAGALLAVCPDSSGNCPSGTASAGGDCADNDPTRFPSAAEMCNGIDEDCDTVRDETFACVQNGTSSCTTACGTPGTRTCNDTCTDFLAACAGNEVCNFCDDNGADGLADELPLATYNASFTSGGCGGYRYGPTTCSSLVSTRNATAGVQFGQQPFRVGYGPITILANVEEAQFCCQNYPEHGWAVVFYLGNTTMGEWLGAGGNNLGVAHMQRGYAAEWRFYDGDPMTQTDSLVLRPLLGDGIPFPPLGPGISPRPPIDTPRVCCEDRVVEMVITPDIPGSPINEMSVTVTNVLPDGTRIPAASCLAEGCPVQVVTGDYFRYGATGATGQNTDGIEYEAQLWRMERRSLCPGTVP
jgi:cysteine-rich repeat protein